MFALREGRPIAALHHVNGRLAGHAVRGSARGIELGQRAYDAQEVDNNVGIRGREQRFSAVLIERHRYGSKRAVATEEPFGPGTGALPWGDLYQPMRELRAAGITS
jgi:hypothetical protein